MKKELEQTIRSLVKKESLRIIKESQASFLKESSSLEKTMKDINDVIDMYEKRLDKLNNEERSAKEKEDFSDLKRIKEEQLEALNKIIGAYNRKVELLVSQRVELKSDIDNVLSKGSKVFNNADMQEFDNSTFQKNWGLQIDTNNSSTKLVKIIDENGYKVISTDIKGIEPGNILKLPPSFKIGGGGKVTVYRIGEDKKAEEIGDFDYDNITAIIKNPIG